MRSSMGGIFMWRFPATVTAVCQIRLSAPVGMLSASRPSAWIAKAWLYRNRHVRYTPNARPSASKPGPRFALDAGTRTVNQGWDSEGGFIFAAAWNFSDERPYLISRISFSFVLAARS